MSTHTYTRGIFILSLLLCVARIAPADEIAGRIVNIHDGDTVTLLTQDKTRVKIRLVGIDAPELKQAYGRVSKGHLASLVANHSVVVDYHKRDRYGRTLGKILIDGIDANLEQVHDGMAWHFKKYRKEQSENDRISYTAAEDEAKKKKLGLWKDRNPVPPWEWRKRKQTLSKIDMANRRQLTQ